MNRIFKEQSSLSFKIFTYINLAGAQTCVLKYRKPGGDEESFPCTIENETEGILRYNVQNGDLDEDGWWNFWVFITFIDGRSAPGEVVEVFIAEEGVH